MPADAGRENVAEVPKMSVVRCPLSVGRHTLLPRGKLPAGRHYNGQRTTDNGQVFHKSFRGRENLIACRAAVRDNEPSAGPRLPLVFPLWEDPGYETLVAGRGCGAGTAGRPGVGGLR